MAVQFINAARSLRAGEALLKPERHTREKGAEPGAWAREGQGGGGGREAGIGLAWPPPLGMTAGSATEMPTWTPTSTFPSKMDRAGGWTCVGSQLVVKRKPGS